MAVLGEIEGLSVPFVLGMLAGAALGLPAFFSPLSLSVAAVLVLTVLAGHPGSWRASVLFFFLGVFSYSSRSLHIDMTETEPLLASMALDSLKELISSIAFPHAGSNGVLLALLTGDRSGLSPSQIGSFRAAGAAHILALSGLHLGLIYMMVDRTLSLISNKPVFRKIRSLMCVSVAFFYTVMTGAGPSIVRAFLFIFFREISRLDPERKAHPKKILFSSLMLQLALTPAVIFSLGFQLSYLAVCGIVYVYPVLKDWYPRERYLSPVHRVWDAVCLTLSCQLFTAPLCWLRFHTFPRYFLLTNLLALPLTGIIMTLAVILLLLSSVQLCPHLLVEIEDVMISALSFVLDAVSSM